jgi:hypothetical protein
MSLSLGVGSRERARSCGMARDVGHQVGIAHNAKVKPPVLIDARLPPVLGFTVFFRPQGRVAQVVQQEERLLLKSPLNPVRRRKLD